jgi:hypothetical protein
MRYLPDDNLSYPVLIELEDGSSGSGFFLTYLDSKQFLVTALHVLYKKEGLINVLRSTKAKLTSYDQNIALTSPIEFELDLSILPIKKDDARDIVLVEMANMKTIADGYDITPINGVRKISNGLAKIVLVGDTSLAKFEDVFISNEVFIIGYPNSLSFNNDPQIEYKRPLLRKGIVAGKNLIKETIILDCPVYFGNSGGLAIQVNELPNKQRQYRIIGVVSQYIPFVERLRSMQMGYENVNFENSGYSVVVPTDSILDLAAN